MRSLEADMIKRRVTVSMLYAQNAPVRWLRGLTFAVDSAAAGLCHAYWLHGRPPVLQRAHVPGGLSQHGKPFK